MYRRAIFIFLFVGAVICSPSRIHAQSAGETSNPADSLIVLFDGSTLNSWKVTQFGPQGTVEVTDSAIVLGYGDPMTGITIDRLFPNRNYEVNLDAKRVDGNDFFAAITFPINDAFASLIVGGWGGGVVGISSIDGYDASENETSIWKKFENDRWYHIRLRVTDERIDAWIDREHVVDFEIGNHELSTRVEVSLNKPFGIATWRTTGAIKNLTVQSVAVEP